MADMVNPQLLRIALEHAHGGAFERFAQDFYGALMGAEFVPLGGVHDAGADALMMLPGLFAESGHPTHFLQASIEKETAAKIRDTAHKLRDAGRTLNAITYITSQHVPRLDLLEARLSEELDVHVRIKDRTYLEVHVNSSMQTRAAYQHHLAPLTAFLSKIGSQAVTVSSPHVDSSAIYVFLRQELERRHGDTSLSDAMVDSLILWALEGTDPEAGILRNRGEIRERIFSTLPAVRRIVDAVLDQNLEALASKTRRGGRAVRWHKKDDLFALPYETRVSLIEENTRDEALRIAVRDSLENRLTESLGDSLGSGTPRKAAQVAIRAVELLLEREGLEFANFLARKGEAQELTTVADCIGVALDHIGIPGPNRAQVSEAVLEALRRAFYYGTDEERQFFGKLSRTYSLLFTLQAEPRVIRYFEELTGDFYLYVGSDILVRALSERYLEPRDQMTRNTLAMAAAAGSTLVLAEPVLEEVVSHLRSSDREFRAYFAPTEANVTLDIARHSEKILIRAYFYAKLDPTISLRPRSWEEFLNQFCDFGDLYKPLAFRQVKTYLETEFGLTFETREELRKLVEEEKVEKLAAALSPDKSVRELAENDALMALSVYGRRDALGEHTRTTEFGYRTWWFTGETAILRYTKEIEKAHKGDRYMMRPEFLLNFIALAPTAAEVRRSYANVFPTALGIRLGRRLDEDAFHKLMKEVQAAGELEEGRRKAKIADIVDRLKADFQRPYRVPLTPSSSKAD